MSASYFRGLFLCLLFPVLQASAQTRLDSLLPVRGLSIAAPTPKNLDSFVHFIRTELAPRKVNLLVLRVDFNYQFKSHPELVDENALSNADVKKNRCCL